MQQMKRRAVLAIVLLLIALVSVTACGKETDFKVDFIVDGNVYATIHTSGKEVLKMPDDPTKDGYIFDGWFRDEGSWKKPFTANSLLDAPLSGNMSVYAKWEEHRQLFGTDADFSGFLKDSDTIYTMKVPNATEILSMESLVTVNSRSTWILTTDIDANHPIASKTATLAIGDNTYYVLVTGEDGQTQLYTLKIRRRAVYEVSLDTNDGTRLGPVYVEEDEIADIPTPERTGYTFAGWDLIFLLRLPKTSMQLLYGLPTNIGLLTRQTVELFRTAI